MKKHISILLGLSIFTVGLSAQNTMSTALNLGTKSSGFSYTNTQNTANYTNDYVGRTTNDVFYKFTLSYPMEMTISHCGSELNDTYLHILDVNGTRIYYNDDSDNCGNHYLSYINQILPIGTYYVVSEGYSQNGNITTAISGRMLSISEYPQTDAGTFSQSFTFSDTKDTNLAGNYYQGKTTKDAGYKFVLTRSMEITISHCGSELADTYMSLINPSGSCIASNDNYTGDGACSNTSHAFIKRSLAAGTYYIVSEGSSQNGVIHTTIRGVVPSVSSTPSANQNYIRTRTYRSGNGQQFTDNIQYFDGLGRPIETVLSAVTPSGKDLVSRIEYDTFGRESKQWLPAPSNNSNGAYNGASTAAAFYSDTKPYSETLYEASPLNRITEQYGPGNAWRTGSHSVKSGYLANTAYSTNAGLACMWYEMVDPQTFRCKGYYPAYELFVAKTTDEDGHVSYEFTDKLGKVILQRKMLGTQRVDVNYIYDDFGRCIFVLTPLGSDEMKQANRTYNLWGTTDLNHDVADLVYYYWYDGRGRKENQKLLGTDVENFVYDKAGRLIFRSSGDAMVVGDNERGWIFYKYDLFGRQILTGLYHGDDFTSANSNVRACNMTQRCKNYLTVETPDISKQYGYTWNNFPYLNDLEITQANYYDNYSYIQANYPELNYQARAGFGTQHTSAKGLLTATRIKVLGDSNREIVSAFYYDTKGNAVQKHSTNQLNGYDREYYAYDFNSHVTKKRIEHTKPEHVERISSGYGSFIVNYYPQVAVAEEYTYNYDHTGRLKTVLYSIDNTSPITMASYTYDEAGRMIEKSTGGIENTNYSYNLRGWQTGQTGNIFTENLYYNTNPYGGNTCFNGNISALQWKTVEPQTTSPGIIYRPALISTTQQGYSFAYDHLNRLVTAGYQPATSQQIVSKQPVTLGIIIPVTPTLSTTPNYDESFTYDKMGNILTLQRYGLKDNNSFGLIDNLTMTYNACQLKSITDAAGNQSASDVMEFKDGYNGSSEYVHLNGKIYADYNKKICQTRYNYLALPEKIQFRYGHQIKYGYDANGVKRTVTHIEAASNANLPAYTGMNENITPAALLTTTTGYTGNKVYVNGLLKRILTEEGYIEKENEQYKYYYYLKDHLGNNRVVLNKAGGTEQINNYYPSGTVMAEYPRRTDQGKQPYKFGNKELDRSFGLDVHDFEWRSLDNAVMRFTTPDPLREKDYAVSPFAYCKSNPINAMDPNGLSVYFLDENGNLTLALKNDDDYDQIKSTVKDKNGYTQITGTSEKIKDQNLLPMLAASPDLPGYHGITTNKTDAFNVFKFAADNSNVEWSLSGFKVDKKTKYYINTLHEEAGAHTGESNGIFEAKDMLFNVHSHWGENHTKGGSGFYTDKTYFDDTDADVATKLFNKVGYNMPTLYVYHSYSKGLYKYNPSTSVEREWLNIKSGSQMRAYLFQDRQATMDYYRQVGLIK